MQYGQFRDQYTVHRKFLPLFCKTLNFTLEPRTKTLAHFKGSECEIAFLKFHFLLALTNDNMEIFLTLCTETCAHDTETCAPYLGNGVYYTETCAVDTENWGQHTGIPVSNTDTCVNDNIDG